jgi:phytoene dehydrogenase-like protein
MKINIIGTGIAGLTAGLTLVKAGHQVELFEQSAKVGGVTSGFEADGYEWDYGQLVVEGFNKHEPIGMILNELGILDFLQLVHDEREYVFPDFTIRVPEKYEGIQWRMDLLKQLFPEETAGLNAYWKDYVRFTRLVTLARRMEKDGVLGRVRFYLSLLPFITKMNWSAND